MKKNIYIIISLALTVGIVWLLIGNTSELISQQSNDDNSFSSIENVVTEKDGIQYINILARGGYNPSKIKAKAGVKTKLVFQTKGTYDCSSAVYIPKLDYRTQLPANGSTIVDVPAEKARDNFDIVCAMGMFRAEIDFTS